MSALGSLLRKELREGVFSIRSAALYLTSVAVLSVFAVTLVSNKEMSLLDNAQAVYLMCCIVLAMGLLVAVVRGSDSFAGERERQTLELLLVAPIRGREIAFAKLGGTLVAWALTFVLAIPYVWAVGSTGQNLGPALTYLFFSGALLTLIFGGVTLLVSARTRSLAVALSVGLTLFLLFGSPVVLGPSLRQSSVGRIIDWINPFAHGLNMLDSVVVDSQGTSFQLAHLAVLVAYAVVVLWCVTLTTKRVRL
jgi:ABC-type transport system involved in multi-copper enzyme maturation permease subunit